MMARVETLVTWDTQLSADSVEWCPFPSKTHLLVCGTYQLIEGEDQLTSSRKGRLHLMSFSIMEGKLTLLQSIEMPAVLDCKWAPTLVHGDPLLGVVNAIGELSLYMITNQGIESLKDEILEVGKIKLPEIEDGSNVLALSLDWSISEDRVRIAVSDSKGRISTFRVDKPGLRLEHCWSAHQFEAWTVHLDRLSPNICYTGGDDAKLRVYDLRSDLHSPKLTCTQHSAGVTSFAQPSAEHHLLSGSYDEQILLWDTRQLRRSLQSTHTGGGVWRIRLQPHTDAVLAACMYDGFHVYDQELKAVTHYQEHSSIAYGAHWNEQTPDLMATCSFYDHKLNISLLNKV